MVEEAKKKEGKKVYTLDDIQFNEANKVMAAFSCVPIVGLIMLFVEKDDKFVRYMGAQSTLVGAVALVASVLMLFVVIPVIGWLIAVASWLITAAGGVMLLIAFIKTLKGERFDLPVISDWALKLMASV